MEYVCWEPSVPMIPSEQLEVLLMIAFKDKRTLNLISWANQNKSFTLTNHNLCGILGKTRSACCVCVMEDAVQKTFGKVDKLSELTEILGTSVDEIK